MADYSGMADDDKVAFVAVAEIIFHEADLPDLFVSFGIGIRLKLCSSLG
ncbi:MAG TPA: hypothetical protein PKH33_15770 [bacterium]|nr:hypothetical protein [bacterium]